MATLQISLDDQATNGLANVDAALDQMAATSINAAKNTADAMDKVDSALDQVAASSKNAVKGANTLTAAQQQSYTITQKQTVGFSVLANTGIKVFGDLANTGVKCFTSIELASIKAISETEQLLIKSTASIIKWGIAGVTASSIAKSAFHSHTQKVKENAAAIDAASESQRRWLGLNLQTAAGVAATGAAAGATASGWKGAGKAAAFMGSTAAKAILGLGAPIAGFKLGLMGLEQIMSHTGERMVEMEDGSKRLENNWNRIEGASGRLGKSVSRDFNEAGNAVKNLFDISIPLPDLWSGIDASMTRTADNMVENIGHVETGYQKAVGAIQGWAALLSGGTEESWKEYRKQQQLTMDLDEQAADQRAKESVGLDRLGQAHERIALKAKARAESDRINALASTQELDMEIQKLNEKAFALAKAGQLSAKTKKDKDGKDAKEKSAEELASLKLLAEYEQKTEILVQRRAAIQKEASTKQREFRKIAHESYSEEMAELDAKMAKENAVYDAEQKRFLQRAGLQRQIKEATEKEESDTGLAVAKDTHTASKDMHSERMKAQRATETQIKTALAAMDKQFAEVEHAFRLGNIDEEARRKMKLLEEEREHNQKTGGDAAERAKKDIEIRAREEQALADRILKATQENGKFAREMNKIELADKLQAQQALFAAERDRIQKIHSLEEAQNAKLKEQFDPKAFGEMQDPAKVRRQLMEDRANAAKAKNEADNSDEWSDAMNGDKAAFKRAKAQQERQMQAARRKAAQDFDNGDVGEGEIGKAQGEVGQQTLQVMGKQGQLNQGQMQVMTDALKALADQQQSIDNNTQTVQQMIAFMKGVKTTARSSVTATQNQQGSLN